MPAPTGEVRAPWLRRPKSSISSRLGSASRAPPHLEQAKVPVCGAPRRCTRRRVSHPACSLPPGRRDPQAHPVVLHRRLAASPRSPPARGQDVVEVDRTLNSWVLAQVLRGTYDVAWQAPSWTSLVVLDIDRRFAPGPSAVPRGRSRS